MNEFNCTAVCDNKIRILKQIRRKSEMNFYVRVVVDVMYI